ncbi:class I adenylate-forming enzyme family protein [Streptomyces beihaiensis]|uniref:Acyl--CoA ligase n=1 Tax=Streptomyces beihaiensis TaxID=2984495 RepID=A0ABT3TS86_9ACTN|nr:class I adenylate-forming enzyme family protein [Streptomyces beihaiensis]MCX3059909.1 acyl--CoA ligase [Streptomyces beihaiensis]
MKKTPRPRNLGALFESYAASTTPVWYLDRPYDIAPERGRTYDVAAQAELVADMSGRLRLAGLRRGERLAIVKENHHDVVILAAAAARIGALPAMISSTLAPSVLAAMLKRFAPRVLVASGSVLAAAAAEGVELTGEGTQTVAVDGDASLVKGGVLLSALSGAEIPAMDLRPDHEPMICTHTSGTTGVPKLVVHSPNTLLGVLTKLETMPIPGLSIRPDDVFGSCISYVHGRAITWTFAQLARPPQKVVVLGGCEPQLAAQVLTEHQPTVLEACPNIFQRWEPLTQTHRSAFSRVRTYVNTFDAIHPPTVRKFMDASERKRVKWGQVWGQTETGPVAMAVYSRNQIHKSSGALDPVTNNVGRPIPFVTQVKVVDPDSRKAVRAGESGVVLVRTKGLCLTYLGEEERHREKVWGGWWNTGDIGVRSRTGALRLLDREVDLIPGVSGIALESILLERIERATEVIVLGDPDGKPVPVLSLSHGELSQQEWDAAVDGLPALAEPRVIDWEDFPRTGTWKVRRFDLRQQVLRSQATFGTGRWT